MPPRKSAKAPASAPPPLDGCIIAIAGTIPGHSQADIEESLIKPLGASLAKTVNQSTTHLITKDSEYAKASAKIKQAKDIGIPIVSLEWLEECLSKSLKVNEGAFAFNKTAAVNGSASTSQAAPKTNGKGRAASKRQASDDSDDNDSAPKSKKAAAPNKKNTSDVKEVKKDLKEKSKVEDAENNITKSKDLVIQLDEHCPLVHHRVYIDDDGLIYDASLNQTNSSNNNNKFYRIQLLRNGSGDCKVWTRWGRVGDRGQSAILGNGSLDDAIRQFDSKFKSKSGLSWDNRGDKPKSGKYTFLERSYREDSDDEEEKGEAAPKDDEEGDRPKTPDSKLKPEVQSLLQLIFNQQYFAATMSDLNYDVNKLPLGKLSKNTITRGYQALKDLSDLVNTPSLAQSVHGTSYEEAAESLSNSYYSLIPHAFGRNRPPIISTQQMINREVDLLDSLSDMKDASNIMKKDSRSDEDLNLLDQQFKGLNLDEMTPLKPGSDEFDLLKEYLIETRGQTHNHNYQVLDIFRISRAGESARFESAKYNVGKDSRLLWHGSRVTNFGGILSQGLRIAPPEAPVSGYMFDKGIYLADMASKSANYCCSGISGGHALLLLCEAELGNPMQKLTSACFNAGTDAKQKGLISTWGQGMTGPKLWKDAECVHPTLKGVQMPDTSVKPGHIKVPNAYLLYNEYIAYDVSQVRLRYLLRVKM